MCSAFYTNVIDGCTSAPEGPDVLMEELDLVRSMNLAIKEERYIDAGNFS